MVAGVVTPREWYDLVANRLYDDHAGAWGIGRLIVGDDAADDVADRLAARAVMDTQSEFLLGFLDKVESGGYDGDDGLRGAAIQARAQMYPDALRGTTNRSMVENVPLEEAWEWRLGAVEENCADCPVLAGMSPWVGAELAYVPGEGGTPCLSNCKCTLIRLSDGQAGIPPW